MIRSAVLRSPTRPEPEAQVASSERSGEASGALNALRAGHRERHVAEMATECLARTGLPWERRVYALWLEELAKKDESLRDQTGRTHAGAAFSSQRVTRLTVPQ
jgi:hypothetical protein